MTGFKLRICLVGSTCSTNCATTTDYCKFFDVTSLGKVIKQIITFFELIEKRRYRHLTKPIVKILYIHGTYRELPSYAF